mgnify:CR=1 FL=1
MLAIDKNKKLSGAILVVVTVAAVTSAFFIHDYYLRGQAYDGVIQETYRVRNWLRWFKAPLKHPEYRYYYHYWLIVDSDGVKREVRVPHFLWSKGSAGTPVKKVTGERYPRIDTPKANEDRNVMERFF